VVGIVVQVGVVALVVGIGMAMVRMVRGPEVADRVLAADVLSLEVVGLVILLAIDQQRSLSLDVALLVAIVAPSSLARPVRAPSLRTTGRGHRWTPCATW